MSYGLNKPQKYQIWTRRTGEFGCVSWPFDSIIFLCEFLV
jgi:hypothetical protein